MLTRFSHYKSMGVFSTAQGQLSPQFVVESCRILNSSEILRFSSIPVIMKIRSKMKTLESEQDYMSFFFPDAQGQLTPKSAMEFYRNSNSSKLI